MYLDSHLCADIVIGPGLGLVSVWLVAFASMV